MTFHPSIIYFDCQACTQVPNLCNQVCEDQAVLQYLNIPQLVNSPTTNTASFTLKLLAL